MDPAEPTIIVVSTSDDPSLTRNSVKLSPSPNRTSPPSRSNDFVNPIEKIEQLLTCPICLDRYKQPKLLPCHHSFCLPCLESYAGTAHRNFKCPECRAEHNVPYDGIKNFPNNLTLMGFLDIHLEATDDNAEQLEAYIQRYNLERCKICDEKSELEVCQHCDRKACKDCRTSHLEMVKRDLGRMLNQVRRLSNRVNEASDTLAKGMDLLKLNGETTKTEVKEYFMRYRNDLKRREEYFLQEVDIFLQAETKVMTTLRDALAAESNNLNDACTWADGVLKGSVDVRDEEVFRIKNVFSEGLEYLRGFQPDTEELCSKKIRFSPGDDASKLPNAISNFGELTVCLPQYAGRYMTLEPQYLPKTFRMGLESENFKTSRRNAEQPNEKFKHRYRRRTTVDDETWMRLRLNAESNRNSPAVNGFAHRSNPWARPLNDDSSLGLSTTTQDESRLSPRPSPTTVLEVSLPKIRQQRPTSDADLSPSSNSNLPTSSSAGSTPRRRPPFPKQKSSTDDPLLNERIESIRQAHEQRTKSKPSATTVSSSGEDEDTQLALSDYSQNGRVHQFQHWGSNPDVSNVLAIENNPNPILLNITNRIHGSSEVADALDDSTTHRYCSSPQRQDSGNTDELLTNGTPTSSTEHRRSRFRRRTSIVPDRDIPSENTSCGRLSRNSSFISIPLTDYSIKYKPKLMFGRRGEALTELNWPRGLVTLPGGEFAVCDSSNHRVLVFDLAGKLIRSFGSYGTEDGELDSCAGISYNRYRQQLVVTDRYNHRVQIFEIDGKFLRQFGSFGTGNSQFNNPWGVAVDELGLIYVVDKDNHRIQVFDQNGNYMTKFGSYGEELGQFNQPLFIAIHRRSQNIFITDSGNHRICLFDHDGTPILSFGNEGFHTGQLKVPRGVALDEQGFVIVADGGNNRVQIFSPDGKFIHGFGTWGTGPGQLKGVEGVAIVGTSIVVTDRENHRIQIF